MARIALNSNIASLNAQRYLQRSTDELAKSSERLSSGLRINRASDDAAGLSISSLLDADSRVYSRAIQNINDAASVLNIAEGSVRELSNVVIRLQELSEQSANGVYMLTQRRAMNNEANRLVEEFNRIVSTTSFNGLNLLDPSSGGINVQAGYGSTNGVIAVGLTNQIRRGVGDGTFATGTHTASGQATTADIVSVDVNNDSILDLVTANGGGSNNISVLLGVGDGTFGAATTIATGNTPSSVEAGDYNGDGKVDLFLTSGFTNVEVLRGDGAGGFVSISTIAVGPPTSDIETGDFNNDGKSDFLVATSGNAYLYLSNGSGNFSQTTSFGAGSLTTGDYNGDGNLDFASAGTGGLRVYYGNGLGTANLGQTIAFPGISSSVESSDINNDGLTDLILGPVASTSVRVHLAREGNTFDSAVTYNLGFTNNATAGTIAATDVNGDGFSDLIAASNGASLAVLLNDGTGAFGTAQTYTAPISSGDIAYGDFNRDGAVDFTSIANLGGGNNIQMFLGNRRYVSSIAAVNINTRSGALSTLTDLRSTLNRISSELGLIGASQSRLTAAFSNLVSGRDNFNAASSRIKDADVAEESAQLVRKQILQQAGASILSQANAQPQIALQLLGR